MTHYFISDLHLKPQRLDVIFAFFDFLKRTAPKAEAIYILGDFFEYWIGDDIDNFAVNLIKKHLKQASAHTNLFFIHGNRDFLVGEDFCQTCGITLLPEQHVITIGNKRILLLHGDELCTKDIKYMEFRKKVRDKLFQRDFLANTIDERIAIALRAREESKDDQQEKSYEIMDVTPEEVEHAIRNHDTDYMLHGHTHRPAVHDLIVDRRAKQRIVLGDWEDKAWYVKWDDNGYELKSYTLLTWSIQVKVFIIERLVMPTIGWVNKLKSVF